MTVVRSCWGTDYFTDFMSRTDEAMRDLAVEVVSITGRKTLHVVTNGQLNPAPDDDALSSPLWRSMASPLSAPGS